MSIILLCAALQSSDFRHDGSTNTWIISIRPLIYEDLWFNQQFYICQYHCKYRPTVLTSVVGLRTITAG